MEQEKTRPLSLGEERVRVNFNVEGSSVVDSIKRNTASLINEVEVLKTSGKDNITPEKLRLIALAQTAYEEAAMWAVKAATIGL